jgi:hypothetical protein
MAGEVSHLSLSTGLCRQLRNAWMNRRMLPKRTRWNVDAERRWRCWRVGNSECGMGNSELGIAKPQAAGQRSPFNFGLIADCFAKKEMMGPRGSNTQPPAWGLVYSIGPDRGAAELSRDERKVCRTCASERLLGCGANPARRLSSHARTVISRVTLAQVVAQIQQLILAALGGKKLWIDNAFAEFVQDNYST